MKDLIDYVVTPQDPQAGQQTTKRRPYRVWFDLSNGERVNAAQLARDPRNTLRHTPTALRKRMAKGETDINRILGPRLDPRGRRSKAERQ